MTATELSIEFDIYYNNIASNQAPGLTDYEKSVFITQAKEEFIKSIYSGKQDTTISFEQTEESRRFLDSLVVTKVIQSPNTDSIKLPDDLWFIVYEEARGKDSSKPCYNKPMEVIPITHDEYIKIKRNPFRGANYRRVLRLDIAENTVQLITADSVIISEYEVRYLKKPSPVILGDLDGLTINGESEVTHDDLYDDYIWRLILSLAVSKAMEVYSPRVNPN